MNQILTGVFFTLTQLVTVVGVPGARLLHDVVLDTKVDEASLSRNTGAVENVELSLLERRSHLVLDNFHAGSVTHGIRALFEGFNPTNVEPDGGVELQCFSA